jgi:hypothetical protein
MGLVVWYAGLKRDPVDAGDEVGDIMRTSCVEDCRYPLNVWESTALSLLLLFAALCDLCD